MSINDNIAQVDVAGIVRTASLQLIDDAKVGDYALLHAGFAIQLLDEDEALETLKLWESIGWRTPRRNHYYFSTTEGHWYVDTLQKDFWNCLYHSIHQLDA